MTASLTGGVPGGRLAQALWSMPEGEGPPAGVVPPGGGRELCSHCLHPSARQGLCHRTSRRRRGGVSLGVGWTVREGRLERAQCWPLTGLGAQPPSASGGAAAVGLAPHGRCGSLRCMPGRDSVSGASSPENALRRHDMELDLVGAAATAGHGPLVTRPERAAGPRTQHCNPEPRQGSWERCTWGQGDRSSARSLWAGQRRGMSDKLTGLLAVLAVPGGTARGPRSPPALKLPSHGVPGCRFRPG